MAYSMLKVYKHGGLLVVSDRSIFSPPSPTISSHYNDLVQYREAVQRCNRLLSRCSVEEEDSMILYIRTKEMNKRINFDKLEKIIVKRSDNKVSDFSNTSAESVRKAKRRFTDIALCNDFSHFVTFTFSAEKVSRMNPVEVVDALQRFCKNYFRRNNGYYVFVPEKHKDGAFHFHGLIFTNNRDNSIVRAIDPHNGQPLSNSRNVPLYNLTSWGYGHSVLEPLKSDNISFAIKYIVKYITKDERCLPRFYYSGGSLIRKPAILYIDGDETVFDSLIDSGGFEFSKNNDSLPFRMCGLWLDDIEDPLNSLV